MRPNRRRWTWAALGLGGLLAACAPTLPSPQLVDARTAYARASAGNAASYAPTSLLDARRALDRAELAYLDAPGSAWEAHLGYLAMRQAQLAEARGDAAAANAELDQARRARAAAAAARARAAQAELQRQQRELQQQSEELQAEREARATSEQALHAEREARAKLEAERNQAIATLREFAAIQETERGMVITLAGSLLFRTDEAVLLPIAQQRLDQIAIALRQLAGGQALVIEGHTDARGTEDFNRRLSAARADAVRAYLVSRGVPPEQIVAVAKGEDEPVASNDSPEGRANNRRVEIVISRAPAPVPPQPPAG